MDSWHGTFSREWRSILADLGITVVWLVLALALATGCKPKPSAPIAGSNYFQTPFQEESQFIVEAIVSDLAEQMEYAASHRLPDPKSFLVVAKEKPGSPLDAPVYELRIQLDAKQKELKTEVAINGPIWDPAVYQNVAAALAETVGLKASPTKGAGDTRLLGKLSDISPATIEQEDQTLSAALENDFGNGQLHEEAAVLLGAFLLRDHSGQFFEIRTPLSRMTAHLAMAQFLNGPAAPGLNGQMARAMLLSLVGDEAPALTELDAMGTNNFAAGPWIRGLRAWNTGDYRPLDELNGLTPFECAQWFCARSDYGAVEDTWPKLSETQQHTIDFVRKANELGYSVEMGHQLLAVSLSLEGQEIGTVYELCHHQALPRKGLVAALNELPEHCFHREAGGAAHVEVIGWGQWALFLQRHWCHALVANFDFLQYKWGVPEEAKDFAQKCDERYGGLRLYPFVRRFNSTEEKSYRQSVDDGFKVTVATPHLVPATCWNWLCYSVGFAPAYQPVSNPHVNEWHYHNPPPGTLYDLNPRLNHPSLIERADAAARFEKLHELAPYDCRIANFLCREEYTNQPTYEQAMGLYQAVLPYSLTALRAVAETVRDRPEDYEKLMLRAAEISPACFYDLADQAVDFKQDDKAAKFLDQAAATDQDSVRVANHAPWRVRYWLKAGETNKAREIADFAGEVYSADGLQAEGIFHEAIHDYAGAFDWYAKDEERYDNSKSLIDFCLRYKRATGSTQFDAELEKRMDKLFPKGRQSVTLKDFQNPPTDGVVFTSESSTLTAAGLKRGDVIVAVYGVRVQTEPQYQYARELKNTPELDLIVWHDGAYHECTPSPPNHLFGVDIRTYQPDKGQ